MARGFGSSGLDQGPCPCSSGCSYSECCGPFHQGQANAQTAEQLMRSRYSAYAKGDVEYLLATHPDDQTPAAQRRRDLRNSCRQTRWLGLTILEVNAGRREDCEGTVSFEAQFSAGGQRGTLRETSLFQRASHAQAGAWLYIRALEA